MERLKRMVDAVLSNWKPLLIGGIGSLMLVWYFGAWILQSTADGRAVMEARAAVIEERATICAAQAQATDGALAELGKITRSYKREGYVKKQSWAKMPGQTGAVDRKVAKLCAEKAERLTT